MKSAVIFLCGLMAGLLVQSQIPLWEAEVLALGADKEEVIKVKRSLTGLCHPAGSQFYDYLKYYTEYDNLTQCVLEGGRLPARVKENVWLYDNYSDFADDSIVATQP